MSEEKKDAGRDGRQEAKSLDGKIETPVLLPKGEKLSEEQRDHYMSILERLDIAEQEQRKKMEKEGWEGKRNSIRRQSEHLGKPMGKPLEDGDGGPGCNEVEKIEKLEKEINRIKNGS